MGATVRPKVHLKWVGLRRNAGIEKFFISTLHRRPNHFICTSGRNATQISLRHKPAFTVLYEFLLQGFAGFLQQRVEWMSCDHKNYY